MMTAMLLGGSAYAQPPSTPTLPPVVGFKYMVQFTGECHFNDQPCDAKVALMQLYNGRAFVQFSQDATKYGLSGKDWQPDAENYFLDIDTLRVFKGGDFIRSAKLQGVCRFQLSADASVFYLVVCDTHDAAANGTRYVLRLDHITETQHVSGALLQSKRKSE